MNEEEYKKRLRQSHLRLQFNLTNIYKKYKKMEENGGSGILVNLDSKKPFSVPQYKARIKRAQIRFLAMDKNFSKTVLSAVCNDKVGLTDPKTLKESRRRDQEKFSEYLLKYGEDVINNQAPEKELESCANEDYYPVADGIEDSFAKIFEEIDARRQPDLQDDDSPPKKKRSRTM